jgi:hypothetical protein
MTGEGVIEAAFRYYCTQKWWYLSLWYVVRPNYCTREWWYLSMWYSYCMTEVRLALSKRPYQL